MDSILPFRVGGTIFRRRNIHFHWEKANFETFYLHILSIKKGPFNFKFISKIRRHGSDPPPLYYSWFHPTIWYYCFNRFFNLDSFTRWSNAWVIGEAINSCWSYIIQILTYTLQFRNNKFFLLEFRGFWLHLLGAIKKNFWGQVL